MIKGESAMQLTEDVILQQKRRSCFQKKIHDEILELIIKNASEEEQVLNENALWSCSA